MDKATQTMIENLQKNTGKALVQWVSMTIRLHNIEFNVKELRALTASLNYA